MCHAKLGAPALRGGLTPVLLLNLAGCQGLHSVHAWTGDCEADTSPGVDTSEGAAPGGVFWTLLRVLARFCLGFDKPLLAVWFPLGV